MDNMEFTNDKDEIIIIIFIRIKFILHTTDDLKIEKEEKI